MAGIKLEGMEEVLELLIQTERQTERMCGRSIYPGAKIVSNECKARLNSLVTDDSLFAFSEKYGRMRKGPTTRQKKFLIESMGIASMRHRGGVYDVKLGFDGYNDIASPRWQNGQPNAMIARSVNKGTSFMVAQPFMDQTIVASKAAAEEAMAIQFDKELEKLWSRGSAHF